MVRNFRTAFRIALLPIVVLLLGVWPSQLVVGEAIGIARLAAGKGQPGIAAAWLRMVMVREPFRAGLREQIARDELSAGDAKSAIEDFQKARESHEIGADGMASLALLLENDGKWEQASGVWEDLLKTAPTGENYAHLVGADRKGGQIQAALLAARSWHALFPQDTNAAYTLAIFLAGSNGGDAEHQLEICSQVARCRNGLISLRAAAAQSALSEDPGYHAVVIGRWLGSLGEWDLAESAFHSGVNLSPGYAEGWAFLGQALQQNGKNGLSELEKALQLNPDSVLTRALMALYWGKAGEYAKAIEQMQAAARLEPARAVWQVELGNLTAQGGDLIAAQVFFRKAEDLEPENPVVWEAQTNFALKYNLELRDLGLPAARRLVELRPDDPASLDGLGSVLLALGDIRGAERILQQSLTIDPNFAAAHYHLGQLYWQLSEQAQAIDYLKDAVRLDEGGTVGTMAGRLLDRILQPDGN